MTALLTQSLNQPLASTQVDSLAYMAVYQTVDLKPIVLVPSSSRDCR